MPQRSCAAAAGQPLVGLLRSFASPVASAAALLLPSLLAVLAQSGAADPSSVLELSRRTLSEERGQFERWCNGTLIAQDGRRTALRQLLSQAQSSSIGDGLQQLHQLSQEATAIAERLETLRLSLADDARGHERRIVAARLDAEDASRDVEALGKAQADPAGKTVLGSLLKEAQGEKGKLQQALQLLQEKFFSNSGASAASGVATSRAAASAATNGTSSAEVAALEVEYLNKKESIKQAQHQMFTSQRSLEVLTAAVEDESAYLADLQSMCGIGQEVYDRLQQQGLNSLEKASASLAKAAAAAIVAKAKPSARLRGTHGGPSVGKGDAPQGLEAHTAAPLSVVQLPKRAGEAPPSSDKIAAAKPSLAAALRSLPAPPTPHFSATAVPAAAKPSVVKPEASARAAPKATQIDSSASGPAVRPAAAASMAAVVATSAKDATAAALAGYDLSDDDDDDAAPAMTAASPPSKSVRHAASAAAAKQLTPAQARAPAAQTKDLPSHTVAASAVAMAVSLPEVSRAPKPLKATADAEGDALSADDDLDANLDTKDEKPSQAAVTPKPARETQKQGATVASAAPPAPKVAGADVDDDDAHGDAKPIVPKQKQHAEVAVVASDAPPAPKFVDTHADDDDADGDAKPVIPKQNRHVKVAAEASAAPAPLKLADAVADEHDVDADAKPIVPKQKHHSQAHVGKQRNVGTDFMDGVYSSAAGTMPSAYMAWTPDGTVAGPTSAGGHQHEKAVSAEDAKKHMSAMFAEDSDADAISSLMATTSPSHTGKVASTASSSAVKHPKAKSSPTAKLAAIPAKVASSAVQTSSMDADGEADGALAAPTAGSDDSRSRLAGQVEAHRAQTSELQLGKGDESNGDNLDMDIDAKSSREADAALSYSSEKTDDRVPASDDTLRTESESDDTPKVPKDGHASLPHGQQVVLHADEDAADPGLDDDDETSGHVIAPAKLATATANSDTDGSTADEAPVKMKKPGKAGKRLSDEEKAAAAFGYDLSDDDDDGVAPTAPPARQLRQVKRHHVRKTKKATPPAPPPELDLDADGAIDADIASSSSGSGSSSSSATASSAAGVDEVLQPSPVAGGSDQADGAALVAKSPAKDSTTIGSSPPPPAAAGGSKLPGQYAAWTPSDAAAAAKQKQAMLAQMESDFDSDDDGSQPTPAPKHHHGHRKTAPPQPTITKTADKDDDGVVYDDDDLPKHAHKSIAAELEGGWRSLMKKPSGAVKSKKPKLDPDIAIMQSLYSDDGALPSQYTAWSPNQQATPAAAQSAASSANTGDGEADSDGDDDDAGGGDTAFFLQVQSEAIPDFVSILEDLQRHTPEDAAVASAVSQVLSPGGASDMATALLERSEVRVDASRVSAAHRLLQQYAEVLQSEALRQLAKARPSPPKLAALSKRLSGVDPLVHPGVAATKGRQAQAEQWCLYFERHEQSVVPMHKALVQVEAANLELSNRSSQRAAVEEEVDARTQLRRAVEQDVQGLSALLIATEHAAAAPDFSSLETQLLGAATSDGPGIPPAEVLLGVGEAAAAWRAAHTELADALRASLNARSATLAAQRRKLEMLAKEAAEKDHDVAGQQAQVVGAQGALSAIRAKVTKVGKSCDATLRGLERRRHAGHMEAHAVDMALKVLGGSPMQ